MSEKFPANNPAESEKSTEERLIDFRNQIKSIAEKEEGKSAPGQHLLLGDKFNLEDLTEEDMSVWEEFQSGKITEESLQAYQKSVAEKASKTSRFEIPTDSRSLFSGLLANMATELFACRELEEEKRKQ